MDSATKNDVTAVILAGGKGKRMGGQDKGQIILNGHPLIEIILDAIKPQVKDVLINANRSHDEYKKYGYKIIGDRIQGFQGPLAGFAAGLYASSTPYIVTLPCDGPLLAPDLVQRLIDTMNREHVDIAVAHDGIRLQPVYALIPKRLLTSLEHFLDSGERKIDRWYEQLNMAHADFSDAGKTFLNINTPDDRNRILKEVSG